jgi:rhomboid family GlyGly-CTERM serine protease
MREGMNNGVGRICVPPLMLAALALVLHLIPGAGAALQYEPGRWWGVFTGHFTHWNGSHLLWDAVAFVTLGIFCCRFSRRRFWCTLLASAIAIPVAIILWLPEMTSYRGLSGIDSALFGLALVEFAKLAQREGRRGLLLLAGLVGGGFALKVVFEFVSGGAFFVSAGEIEFVNVPLAHLVGFGCGVMGACLWGVRSRQSSSCEFSPPILSLPPRCLRSNTARCTPTLPC